MFDLTLMENEQPNQFILLALHFLSKNVMQGFIGNSYYVCAQYTQSDEIKHLLDLLHSWHPATTTPISSLSPNIELDDMPCATKLEALGIEFRKSEDSHVSLFDIKFKDGVLSIPKLTLDRQGEKVFLNLLAYEQSVYYDLESRYVTDYVRFMAALINTTEDVELLRSCGVIKCEPSKDEVVLAMFKELADNVLFSTRSSHYLGIINQVQNLGDWKRKWNAWKAAFWRDYCINPWVAISVIAATVLLIITMAQTTYTILPYYHPHNS